MADDDTIQLDSSLTAQSSSAPVTFEDLRSFLSSPSSAQTQTSNAAQASGFDAKTQDSLDGLQPDFADKAKQWIQAMRDNGYDPVLHFGYRTPQEQQILYQKHLAGGPQAVAPPMSYHTYGRAFDWVNRDAKGNLQWNNDKAYEFGQKLAKNFGLTGIGAGDNDHIQDANYKTWKDLPRDDYGRRGSPRSSQAPQLASRSVPSTPAGGTVGGVTWEDLSGLMQR